MGKLYPPIIEGSIPAFYGSTLKVPFIMNKSVNKQQIIGFALKIKTVQSNYLFDIIESKNWDSVNNEVMFDVGGILSSLNIGQFYKIQIAYISIENGEELIGYYSTIGVIKYTSKPKIQILDNSDGKIFTALYSQEKQFENEIKDYTEKVYSYCFTLKDSNNNIIESSGELLHNSSEDTALYESIDTYILQSDLEKNKAYYLEYSITTINGLKESVRSKKIFKSTSIDSALKAEIIAELDYENGCIDINLKGIKNEEGVEYAATGTFYLLRSSSEDDFNSWNEVYKFVLYGQHVSRYLWRDMTIKQGVKYKYAIEQYNIYNLRSNRIESNIIYSDFEYAYLFDGERQLKIKFNPKVTSFKNTLMENKIDTIGNKYPFIFRNGSVNYKEFPISGLISYLSDEKDLFYNIQNLNNIEHRPDNKHNLIKLTDIHTTTKETYMSNIYSYYIKQSYNLNEEKKEYYVSWVEFLNKNYPEKNVLIWEDIQNIFFECYNYNILYVNIRKQEYNAYNLENNYTDLTSNNIYLERQFKLNVLDWLTDGKPKLFRSPTEGNYIVRLLNVSLTPNDQLGRMIHTFNCTAYEIANNNYNNLLEYEFIPLDEPMDKQLRWSSIEFPKNNFKDGENVLTSEVFAIKLEGMIPGEKIQLETLMNEEIKNYSIVIGVTGNYIIDLNNNVKILSLSFVGSPDSMKNKDGTVRHQGMLTYAYYSNEFKDNFDTINKIAINLVPCKQFIGKHNIIKEIENIKEKIHSIGYLRFTLRNDQVEVYKQDEQYYLFKIINNKIDENNLEPIDLKDLTDIYKVYKSSTDLENYTYYDGYNDIDLGKEYNPNYTKIFINDSEIDIVNTLEYSIKNPKDIISIETEAAIICDICYQSILIDYDFEEIQEKNEYEKALNELSEKINFSVDITRTELKEIQDNCTQKYKSFIEKLDQKVLGQNKEVQ